MSEPAVGPSVIDYRASNLRRPPRVRSFDEEISKLAALSFAFVAFGLHGSMDEKGPEVVVLSIVGWAIFGSIGLALFSSYFRSIRAIRSASFARCTKVIMIGTVLQCGIMLEDFSCPHGSLRWNNYLGLAHSKTGGPCHNSPKRWSFKLHVFEAWYFVV